MVVPKPHVFFNQVRLAGLLLLSVFFCSLPAGAQDNSAAVAPSPASASSHTRSRHRSQTHPSVQAQATLPAATATHHRRHHAVAQAAEPPQTTRSHGKHHSHEVTAATATVFKVNHGKGHAVVEEITVDRHGRKHKHYREVAQETVVRDRHGHIIRRVFNDLAHTPHRPLQSEEPTIQAKTGDEFVQKESEELPHEYGSYTKVYALFDEATNARLFGNYKSAIATLSKALDMVPANAHGGPSVLTLNMEYELAQAAEATGDLGLASRYYARAVADRPNFTEAFVRLANVLARNGQAGAALRAARSAVEHNPNDPRAHTVLSVMLSRNGLVAEARVEKIRAQGLLGDNTRIDAMPATTVETPLETDSAGIAAVKERPSESQGAGLDEPSTTAPNDSSHSPVTSPTTPSPSSTSTSPKPTAPNLTSPGPITPSSAPEPGS